MAGATKRLQKKPTGSQNASGELMMLTYEWWMHILIPDLRCYYASFSILSKRRSSFWLEWHGLRMLNKAWREVLERGVKMIIQFHQRFGDFRVWCAPCYHEVEFVRNSCYVMDRQDDIFGVVDRNLYCTLSVPWSKFKGFYLMLAVWAAGNSENPCEERLRTRDVYPPTVQRIYDHLLEYNIIHV